MSIIRPPADVRYGSKADICAAKRHVRFTPKRTCAAQLGMSAMANSRHGTDAFVDREKQRELAVQCPPPRGLVVRLGAGDFRAVMKSAA
jgi:hypothetical protein